MLVDIELLRGANFHSNANTTAKFYPTQRVEWNFSEAFHCRPTIRTNEARVFVTMVSSVAGHFPAREFDAVSHINSFRCWCFFNVETKFFFVCAAFVLVLNHHEIDDTLERSSWWLTNAMAMYFSFFLWSRDCILLGIFFICSNIGTGIDLLTLSGVTFQMNKTCEHYAKYFAEFIRNTLANYSILPEYDHKFESLLYSAL